jgi:RloB-like protein
VTFKRRRFQRPLGQQSYKKLFIIAVEGNKTEFQYFNHLKTLENVRPIIRIKCLKSNHKSSPAQVLKKMLEYLKQESLKKSDEAWIVVDKDNWTNEQLKKLYDWALSSQNYGFALSNPKFEYWLILHFEDGSGITTSHQLSTRLAKYFPNYNKGIDFRKMTYEKIYDALYHAKLRDNPPCVDFPRTFGVTTVYKLIARICGNK